MSCELVCKAHEGKDCIMASLYSQELEQAPAHAYLLPCYNCYLPPVCLEIFLLFELLTSIEKSKGTFIVRTVLN